MKKTYKALLCGAAAVAAVGIAYAMDERFFEKAKDKLTAVSYTHLDVYKRQ